MKVKSQDLQKRGGQSTSQYPRLQPPNSSNDGTDMGKQMLYHQQESPDNYPDPISAYFGPGDPEVDDEDDDAYSPTQEEFEAFMSMVSGIELPSQQLGYIGRPNMGSMNLPPYSQVSGPILGKGLGKPFPDNMSTSKPIPGVSGAEQVAPSSATATDLKTANQQVSGTSDSTGFIEPSLNTTQPQGSTMNVSQILPQVGQIPVSVEDIPKIRVRLRKGAGTSEGPNDGLQMLENLMMGQSTSPKVQYGETQPPLPPASLRNSSSAILVPPSGSQDIIGMYPVTASQAGSLSPAMSAASDVQSMLTDGDDTMDSVAFASYELTKTTTSSSTKKKKVPTATLR